MSAPPSTDVLSALLAEHASRLPLSQLEVDYIVDRLSRIGVFENVNNWGGILCLYPHEHGDGHICSASGPLFDRRYIRRYASNDDGLADLFRIAHHATLSGPVEDFVSGSVESVTLAGYRSIEVAASDVPEVVGSFVDSLDGDVGGVISDIEDRVVKSAVHSFCRNVLKDEKKAAQVAGFVDDVKDKIVRSAVVSFCRGEMSASAKAERADKLSGFLADKFGPNEEAQRRIEEVAAQWGGLKKKMDADPKIEKMLRDSYAHWVKFFDKYQKRNDFWVTIPELKDIAADVRPIIAEVNMARANVESKFVQDLPVCKPGEKDACKLEDVKSETSSAQETAQKVDDSVKSMEKGLADVAADNKWKLLAAGVLGTLALAAVAKVAL